MSENQNEPQTEKSHKVVYFDQSRYASKEDMENLGLRNAKTSRVLNSKGYYKMGHIHAIRSFT